MKETDDAISTKALIALLGCSRARLFYLMKAHKIEPIRKIVNGRCHNFFSQDMVQNIVRLKGE